MSDDSTDSGGVGDDCIDIDAEEHVAVMLIVERVRFGELLLAATDDIDVVTAFGNEIIDYICSVVMEDETDE